MNSGAAVLRETVGQARLGALLLVLWVGCAGGHSTSDRGSPGTSNGGTGGASGSAGSASSNQGTAGASLGAAGASSGVAGGTGGAAGASGAPDASPPADGAPSGVADAFGDSALADGASSDLVPVSSDGGLDVSAVLDGGAEGGDAADGSASEGGSCALSNCSGSGFTYTCGTPNSSEETAYCIIAGSARVKTRTTTFTNGHVVTCQFVCGTSGATCTDGTGATCSFSPPDGGPPRG